MQRIRKQEITITDFGRPLTLGDLHWLVEEADAAGLDENAKLVVKGGRELSQFDRDPASITVSGTVEE